MPRLTQRPFGVLPDGRPVDEYTLDNERGTRLSAINLGGIVTALHTPDRDGRSGNVLLGFPTLEPYLAPHPHFGTLVGRHANRIAQARFTLDGQTHVLAPNDGPHALHGGPNGFGKQWWTLTPAPDAPEGSVAIDLALVSEHGDGGYPGRMETTVRYTLDRDGAWRIDYRATCDRPTVVNLTQHAYFNLAGGGSALQHRLHIEADRFVAVGPGLIPTGLEPVAGSPFDFRQPTRIEDRIREPHPQLARAGGYDHCWVLRRPADTTSLSLAARLEDDASGRVMEVLTTEPGLQFYSGNFLDGTLPASGGRLSRQGDGLCLETQHFPDGPNRPDFPTCVLRPGEVFRSTTVYRFGVAPHTPR